MSPDLPFQRLADLVLAVHLAIVVFIVGGLLAIVIGNLTGTRWVNKPWFRVAHLAAIGFVVVESWFGAICPLTSLEIWLRIKARASPYADSFIAHWVHRLLYYEAPSWVFTLAYTVFGVAVAAAWWYFPPDVERRPPDAGH